MEAKSVLLKEVSPYRNMMRKIPPIFIDLGLADLPEVKTTVTKAKQMLISLAHRLSWGNRKALLDNVLQG